MGKKYTFPLILLLGYIFVEYGRVQFLHSIHASIIIQVILLFLLINNLNNVVLIIKDNYFKLYLLLLLEMMIHGPIATNNYYAYMLWRTMISYFIISLSFCLFIDDVRKMKIVIGFLILIHLLSTGDRLITKGLVFTATGFMGESNDFAMAMNCVIPLGFLVGLSYKGGKRIGLWLATIILVIGDISTFSRGGFVGMVCVALLCWWKTKAKIKALLVLLLVTVVFLSFLPLGYKEEIRSIGEEGAEHGTGRDRIELWKIAWKVFIDNPLIGVGQGNLQFRIGEYQYDENGESFWQRGIGGRVAHSIYFTVLPELGIIGTIIWILMVYNVFAKYHITIKSPVGKNSTLTTNDDQQFIKNCITGLFIGIVGYLITGIFLSAFFYPHFWNFAGLITALYMIKSKMELKR